MYPFTIVDYAMPNAFERGEDSLIFSFTVLSSPSRSDYNIVSDQELWGTFDPARLALALKRFSRDFIILHSKIQNIQEQLYWAEDDDLFISLDYFKNTLTEVELLQYVQQPFNLTTGPLLSKKLTNEVWT